MPTSWGDTMVYGARYSTRSFVSCSRACSTATDCCRRRSPTAAAIATSLAVRVRDHAGNLLFDSAPGRCRTSSTLDAHVELPARAGTARGRRVDSPRARRHAAHRRTARVATSLPARPARPRRGAVDRRRDAAATRRRARAAAGRDSSRACRTSCARRSRRSACTSRRCGSAARRPKSSARGRSAHIERETTRLSHLVENVLRFSTLGADDPTQRESIDVGAEVATHRRRVSAARRVATHDDRRRRRRRPRRSRCAPMRCDTSCSTCSTTR